MCSNIRVYSLVKYISASMNLSDGVMKSVKDGVGWWIEKGGMIMLCMYLYTYVLMNTQHKYISYVFCSYACKYELNTNTKKK